MKLEIIKGDLFDVKLPENSFYAHCISADFALGAGIAKIFDKKFGTRYKLCRKYSCCKGTPDLVGTSCIVDNIFNLVTKWHYYDKPTLDSLELAINQMRKQCYMFNIKNIYMPKIGCGLDKLKWDDVSKILEKEFKNTDINIFVYYLK